MPLLGWLKIPRVGGGSPAGKTVGGFGWGGCVRGMCVEIIATNDFGFEFMRNRSISFVQLMSNSDDARNMIEKQGPDTQGQKALGDLVL